jgi:hypothetical protein
MKIVDGADEPLINEPTIRFRDWIAFKGWVWLFLANVNAFPGFRKYCSPSKLLILVIFGLLLKLLWTAGCFDYLLVNRQPEVATHHPKFPNATNSSCACYGENVS